MNNKIPKELAERQEQQRQNTVNIVRRAIEDLAAEGHKITIKLLMEYTGLSRSVFGKPHIHKILLEYEVVGNNANKNLDKDKMNIQKCILQQKIKKQAEVINKLEHENNKLREECEILRGTIFLLYEKNNKI